MYVLKRSVYVFVRVAKG